MKQDFTIDLQADNNFSVLNRIINVLNRRRVRIKKILAYESEQDFRRGGAILLVFTTSDIIAKVLAQLEKLIEVDNVCAKEGSDLYFELSERIVDID